MNYLIKNILSYLKLERVVYKKLFFKRCLIFTFKYKIENVKY